MHRTQGATAKVGEGDRTRKSTHMDARRPATVVPEVGEVDASGHPIQQRKQVENVGRLWLAAGNRGEYSAQQSHGKPFR